MINLHEAARCRKDGVYTPVYELCGADHKNMLILKDMTWFAMIGEDLHRIPVCVYENNSIIELI